MSLSLERIFYVVSVLILFIRIYFLESEVDNLNKRNYDLLMKLWKRDRIEEDSKNGKEVK